MEKITLGLTKKQARGLKKLAEVWGVSPEAAIKRLLDDIIEKSL